MPAIATAVFSKLNLETDARRLEKGEYRYLLNGIVNSTADNNAGSVENYPGTRALGNSLPVGTNTTIHSLEDRVRGRVIFFNANSNGNDGIYVYDAGTDTFQTLIQWSGLNFSTTARITGACVVDDHLFWTDGVSDIRHINIALALAGSYPASWQAEYVSLIKRPPHIPLTVQRAKNTNVVYNYIRDRSFQFTYRYIYLDNEKSRIAPVSKSTGLPSPAQADNNLLVVTIPASELVPETVAAIEFIVRLNNAEIYTIVRRVARLSNGTIQRSFDFYNDVSGSVLAGADVAELYDDVPWVAGGLAAVRNRLWVNNYKKGWLPMTTDFSAEALPQSQVNYMDNKSVYQVWRRMEFLRPGQQISAPCMVDYEETAVDEYYYLDAGIYTRCTINIGTINEAFKVPGGLSGDAVAITGWRQSISYETCPTDNSLQALMTTYSLKLVEPANSFRVYTESPQYQRIFPGGDAYQFMLTYYDFAGRIVGQVTGDRAKVQIPSIGDAMTGSIYGVIKWKIGSNFDIPVNATHYSIDRTTNLSRRFFIQHRFSDIFYAHEQRSDGEIRLVKSITDSVKSIYIDISNLTFNNIGYVYSKGDRIRIHSINSKSYDLEIQGQDGRFLVVEFQNVGVLTNRMTRRYTIYTPSIQALNESFVEIGERYKILNAGESNRTHELLEGTVGGDCYLVNRDVYTYATSPYVFDPISSTDMVYNVVPAKELFEAMSLDDNFYELWLKDEGRPIPYIADPQVVHDRYALKFSDPYIPGTKINGLCAFRALNEYQLKIESGLGVCLSVCNGVLCVHHERESSSAYIGEGFMQTSDQNEFLVKVNNIVGDDRRLMGGMGTIHPESIVVLDDNYYAWDAHKNTLFRYGQEGLTDLGEAFTEPYLRNLGIKLFPYRHDIKIIGGHDPQHELVFWTFPPVAAINYPGETIVFQRRHGYNVFTGWVSFAATSYVGLNKKLYSFNQGQMHAHDDLSACNTFYGVAYNRVLRFVLNDHYAYTKAWTNLKILAESICADPQGVTIPIRIWTEEQEAWVYAYDVEFREGYWYGMIYRDVNTPGLSTPQGLDGREYARLVGDVMKGGIAEVEYINDRRDRSVLHEFSLLYHGSETPYNQ